MITFNEESEKVPTAIIELTKIDESSHEDSILTFIEKHALKKIDVS